MGNGGSSGAPRRSSLAQRETRTRSGPAAMAARPTLSTEMIPDQFTSLPQVTTALRRNGLESCNMIVGIDFTKSNEWSGKRTFQGRCLHDIDNPSEFNPYESVIDTIGRTLRDFDEDNVIPVYGFGDELTGDHSVFSFADFAAGPRAGFPFEKIRGRYREVVRNVTMAGPTSFAPIINQAVNIVNATGGEYHILVIIADGQVTRSVDVPPHAVSKNEKETIDAITYASQFPLSIIMVGVGDGPWEAMNYFDNYLLHRRFDNFQFVEYHKIMAQFHNPQMRETQFALQALMEVPDQYRIIKEMGYLNRRQPFQFRNDVPHVEVFPPPQSPVQQSFTQPFRVIDPIPTPTTTNGQRPSAPSFLGSTTVDATPMATQVYQSATLDRRTSSAELELARIQEEMLCPICEEKRKDLVFQCGHETCVKCGEMLQDCPICRQRIQVRIKRYG